MLPSPSKPAWHTHGARLLSRVPSEEKYRTCCNCCHIKTGTLFLGLVELVAAVVIFGTVAQQVAYKSKDVSFCLEKRWRDCLIYNFSHFNVTLVGDYLVALLMIAITACVLLLFYGICYRAPKFLLPHLIVQAMGLLVSFGYFLMYAWSYFYGDLYTQKRHFEVQYFVERMWLASILLMFSIFQCYLFIAVLKCSLYLNSMRKEKLRRSSQFEEVSNRVRLAKENGLWRSTSWGGGFQEYRGQFDSEKTRDRNAAKSAKGVQWDLQNNIEKSITCSIDSFPSSVVNEVHVNPGTSSANYAGHLHHPTPAEVEVDQVYPGVKEAGPKAKHRRSSIDVQAGNDQPSSPGRKTRKHGGEKRKHRNSRGTDDERHASDSPVALQKAGAVSSVTHPGTSQGAASCYVNHAEPVAGSSVSPRSKRSHRHAEVVSEHTSGIGDSSKIPTKGSKAGYEGTSGHRKTTPHDSSSSPIHIRETSSKSSSGESPPTRRGSRSQPVQHPIVKKVFISSTTPTTFQSAIL